MVDELTFGSALICPDCILVAFVHQKTSRSNAWYYVCHRFLEILVAIISDHVRSVLVTDLLVGLTGRFEVKGTTSQAVMPKRNRISRDFDLRWSCSPITSGSPSITSFLSVQPQLSQLQSVVLQS
jgi:hypothetical protein